MLLNLDQAERPYGSPGTRKLEDSDRTKGPSAEPNGRFEEYSTCLGEGILVLPALARLQLRFDRVHLRAERDQLAEFGSEKSVAAADRADQRDKTEHEQQPVHLLHPPEVSRG